MKNKITLNNLKSRITSTCDKQSVVSSRPPPPPLQFLPIRSSPLQARPKVRAPPQKKKILLYQFARLNWLMSEVIVTVFNLCNFQDSKNSFHDKQKQLQWQ